MNAKSLLAFALSLIVVAISAAPLRQLSFYPVRLTEKAPKIDGRLDDACYKQAAVYKSYYEYYKSNPGPGKLKTEFRMLYDRKGIYLGIVNYEKNLDELRKKYTVRDASALWTDDCAEIYFDSYCDGVGFTKFVVSAGGILGDMRRIDAAITLADWNGSAWSAAVAKRKDAWIIEAFFPWSDLGGRAETGSLWKFCHVRYAWSTGKFVGVTSAPGGNYNRPEDFGFIYFAGKEPVGSLKIGKLLATKTAPPWCLLQGNSLLVCESSDRIKLEKLTALSAASATSCNRLIKELRQLDSKSLKAVKTDILEVREVSFDNYRKLEELNSKLLELRWKLKLNKLVNNIK
jgi:Carbohydrate family 9 binding domain-like